MLDRRTFLKLWGIAALGLGAGATRARVLPDRVLHAGGNAMQTPIDEGRTITLFLCGDVMTGRGIDQVLPYRNDPRLFEPFMRSAQGYLALAEQANGAIPRPVEFAYVWGDPRRSSNVSRPMCASSISRPP